MTWDDILAVLLVLACLGAAALGTLVTLSLLF
jgi:hypothetical protein